MTVGVEFRVEQLADRPQGFKPKDSAPYHTLLPLSELISAVVGVKQLYSQKIWAIYNKLIDNFGSEYAVLLEATESNLNKVVDEKLAELIVKNRNGKIKISPGYDGVYGEAVLDGETKPEVAVNIRNSPQKSLGDF